METLEVTFADGSRGRLSSQEGESEVVCHVLADGTTKTAEEAGTLYVLQDPGDVESPLVAPALAAGYTLEVQVAESITLPPPDPPVRRRRSED